MTSFCQPLRLHVVIVLLQLTVLPVAVVAQTESDQAQPTILPGWKYQLTGHDGRRVQGISAIADWNPDEASMDSRVAEGPFQVHWSGLLRSEGQGDYQFACYVKGSVQLRINGALIIDDVADQPRWVRSDSFELSSDFHDVSCDWSGTDRQDQLALYWKGPRFGWERLPEGRAFHRAVSTEPTRNADSNWADSNWAHTDWLAGRSLVDSLRCTACHGESLKMSLLSAPDLTRIQATLRPEWIYRRLRGEDPQRPANGHRTMPEYDLNRKDATALTSFLLNESANRNLPEEELESIKAAEAKGGQGDPIEQGRKQVVSMGCLACHQYDELGNSGPYSGGDLTHVADKRPDNFFASWLREPKSLNSAHRMPRFVLDEQEIGTISKFLASCRADVQESEEVNSDRFTFDQSSIQRGRELYDRLRCASCHETKGVREPVLIADPERFEDVCGGAPSSEHNAPGYSLNEHQRRQIIEFISHPPEIESRDVELKLARNNCVSCHKRGDATGIGAFTTAVFERFPSLAKDASAFRPPSLDRIGDKMYREAMIETIRQGGNRRRPWLQVRMPVYPFNSEQREELVNQLVAEDRMPAGLTPSHEPLPADAIAVAGPRLITSTGFGCASCHAIGSIQPPAGPLNARGPSLSMIGEQVRQDWFRRWVANPARFEPDMEMPSIQLSVDGVLDGDLERQLTAVWQTLNQPGFEPPLPSPVRIVRHSGLDSEAPPHLLTDVVRSRSKTYTAPFVMGFQNRHSILFDLESLRLTHWWAGDVMRQHTEGKSWFWELGGTTLWEQSPDHADWSLVKNGEVIGAHRDGQFITELDAWEHMDEGVKLQYRVTFTWPREGQSGDHRRVVKFTETYRPIRDESTRTGWIRQVAVEGLQVGEAIRFNGLVTSDARRMPSVEFNHDRTEVELANPQPVRFAIAMPSGMRFNKDLSIDLPSVASEGEQVKFAMRATTDSEVDTVHLPPLPRRLRDRVASEVVPGFEGWKLPIRSDWMPTALAWDPQGRMYVASLKGRVWRVIDRDNDGWEDDAVVFSDELAAPFGLSPHATGVDVINKFALLRLEDRNGDGRSDATRRLASGWGHTADYHDWSVGLPRDADGNYYVATSCQQDDRSEAAAKWRGKVLKLSPKADGTYDVQELSAGHRFPIGIALREDGELFVTDNQGNYNPFNELNHVVAGARYGFINRLEQGRIAKHAPQEPAICIPHPWTRSVNGICFLDGDAEGHPVADRRFGPFTGHLIGCEYDTRRLVRMSLQLVNGQFQGAVYPFSLDPANDDPALLGPLACAVSPTGDLYVANIRDSGWGGASNIGGLVRLRFRPEKLPAGIAEVLATSDGFRIVFTRPVSPALASDPRRYRIDSYRRVPTPAYGGPDVDRRREEDFGVKVSADAMAVDVSLPELRAGFVYEFALESLVEEVEDFYPAEAFYSLNQVPQRNQVER